MQIKHSKPYINKEDIKAIAEQTKSGIHAYNGRAKEFENQFLKLIKHKYAKAVSSGTIALHLALEAMNIKKGNEVILPSYVCQSVLHAVNQTKATPILADISKNSPNISIETIQPLITKKTKAIILPHLFGIPTDIEPIIETAKKYNIPIIEDCAQSLGAKFSDGKLTGSKATISIFSFYATKIISTGHGGMILTFHQEINQKLQKLTTCGRTQFYNQAYSYNLSDIQASLGLSQLKKLPQFIKRRKEIAKKYNKEFQKLPITLTDYKTGFPFRYIIQLKNKEQKNLLKQKFKEKSIDTEEPVFKPLHRYLNLPDNKFKNTSEFHDTALSIPIYPALTDGEMDYVIDTLKGIFNNIII